MGRAGFAEILPPDQFCLGSAGFDWRSCRQMKWFQFSAIFLFFPKLNSFPWLRPQPCTFQWGSFEKMKLLRLSVLTKVRPAPASVLSSLGRPEKEFAPFFEERSIGCFSLQTYLTEEQPTEHNAYFPFEWIEECWRCHQKSQQFEGSHHSGWT